MNDDSPANETTPPSASTVPAVRVWVGRARSTGDVIGVLLIAAVIAWLTVELVSGRAQNFDYVILAVSAVALLITGSNLVNPPRIRLEEGRFVFRLPLGATLKTPQANVRRVELAARKGLLGLGERLCLQIEFKEPDGVEPPQLIDTLKKNFDQQKAHLITDAFFTKEQLDDFARALSEA